MTVTAQAQTDSTSVRNDSIAWDKDLDGVTVTAMRRLIKQDIDRIGYDVQADEDSKTVSVLDMLRKVPMVMVDGEDNIKVRGNENFKIYKNGHLDPSLTKNAKEVLKTMPATAVKRIEVITDPGAREDAEGANAILNIVMTDTKKMEGVTGSVSGSYGTMNNPGLNAFLTTQWGKATMSLDYGYNNLSKKFTSQNSYLERTFVESGNTQRICSDGSNPGYIHYADVNASYEIDTLNLLSASFGGYFYKVDVQGGGTTTMSDASGSQLYSYTESYWLPSYNHNSWNGRLDYEHKTRRKGELFTLSYMLALTRQHSEQEDHYTDMQNAPFSYTGLLVHKREHFTEHTFQADYIRPLWESHKLEVGAKYIDRRNSSDTQQDYFLTPTLYPNGEGNDYSQGSSISTPLSLGEEAGVRLFHHSTQIGAAYADYIYNKERWSARVGLRYEYSYLKGSFPDGSSQGFDKHLHDWVPQASVKFQINDCQSLKLGYTTSITRPGINYLNPAVVRMPSSVSYGMPRLVSTRQQTLSLTYMYVGQRLTLQLVPHYSYYHNGIGSFIYSQGNLRYSTYGNNLRQHRWQMEGYVQWKPFDSTTLVANLNFTDNYAKNTDAGLSQHTDNLFYYVNLSQKLPWKLLFTAYTFGQFGHSPMNIYAYSRPWNRYAFTLQRSFLSDDRLTVRLMANSPFHKNQHDETRTTQGDIIGWGDEIMVPNGRFFKLSVSYRFGKLKASVKKTETTIENSDEVGGIIKGK